MDQQSSTSNQPLTTVPNSTQPNPVPESPDPVSSAPPVMPSINAPKQTDSSKKFKVLAIVIMVLTILGGGSIAAYYSIVVPNKPENILKTALQNTLSEDSIVATSRFEGKEGDSPAFKVDVTSQGSSSAKTLGVDAKVTVSGITMSAEARYVDSSAYIKVSDLSNVTDILTVFAPEYGELATQLNGTVSNQWFEIDSTLLKDVNAGCFVDKSLTLERADYEFLEKRYAQHPFMTISNTTPETVNGQQTTKFDLIFDGAKSRTFGDGLGQLPLLKKLNECAKVLDESNNLDQEVKDTVRQAGTENLPLTVWVDTQTKRISKIAVHSSEKDKKAGIDMKFDTTLAYTAVTISRPEKAKPITSLLGELGSLYSSLSDSQPTEDLLQGLDAL